MTHRLRWNLRQMKSQNQWKSLLNFRLPTLTPIQSCKETCCKTVSINSNTFWKTKSYPNFAAMHVWKLLLEDNSSLHIMKKKDPTKWRIHVENTRHLEVNQNLEREGGFSEIRRSARSSIWSAFIKNVTVLKSWSTLCFETKQFLGFELGTELTKTLPKRQKPLPLKILNTKMWAQRINGETCCEGQATTEASCDIVSCLCSYWKKMDGHWHTTNRSKLFCSI